MNTLTDYRTETDSIGEKHIPKNVYYGVQSLRAAENFHITGLNMHPEIISSLACIKKLLQLPTAKSIFLTKNEPTQSSKPAMKFWKENILKILS